jgi:hypothetical protein
VKSKPRRRVAFAFWVLVYALVPVQRVRNAAMARTWDLMDFTMRVGFVRMFPDRATATRAADALRRPAVLDEWMRLRWCESTN